MAYPRPTLTTIIDRVLADLSSRVLGASGAVLRRSVLGVIGRVLAGASHELHGRLDYIALQVLIDTADREHVERWANIWGLRYKSAAFAVGAVTFTGTLDSPVLEDTVLQRQDGAQFRTTQSGTFTSTQLTLPVRAVDAGAAGNTPQGITLTLQQPISGVQATAITAAGGLSAGSDPESPESLRSRLLARLQHPPQGGAKADYELWAREVPGVTRAWVYPHEMGLGTVTVRFVRDDDENLIPDETEVAAVRAHIETKRPVTAKEFYVVPPIAAPLDMTIQLTPNTPEVQAAVAAELRDLLRREAQPGGTVPLSHLNEAISTAPGEYDHRILSPTENVVHDRGEMAVLGELTFVSA